jgi:hypothetical protein
MAAGAGRAGRESIRPQIALPSAATAQIAKAVR